MEIMGGPESLMAALGSNFKVSSRMHAERCQRIKMEVDLTKVRQRANKIALNLISIKKVVRLWDVQVGNGLGSVSREGLLVSPF